MENLKTFRTLNIGDKIYSINTKKSLLTKLDEYKNLINDGNVLTEIDVTGLLLLEDGINVNRKKINAYSGPIYNSELIIPIKKVDSFTVGVGDKIFFSDRRLSDKLQAKYALKEIKQQEQDAVDFAAKCQKNIESVRERYFRVLNPSIHKKQ